ncbi:MAG: hypothetical protein K0M67_20895 [Thiobacillus sp.]|nr:hypothetical protein [Thiobacillus sp.]
MARSVAASKRPGIEQAYGEIINVLRQYGAHSVVQVTLDEMWRKHEDKLEFVKRLPWLQLLLVKWALQDKRVGLTFGPQYKRYTPEQHLALVNKLWDIDYRDKSSAAHAGAIWRLMRRIMNVQFDFQKQLTWSFLRWPALIARLPRSHRARELFAQAMGMQPETYADLAMAVFSVLHDDKRYLDAASLRPLTLNYGNDLEKFLALFVRSLGELRDELQTDPARRTRGMAELHEFPYLQRFPLLALGDGRLQLWHPLVFARGLENAVHLRLSAMEQAYTESYSKIFESYVTELAMNSCPQGIPETAYRQRCGPLGKAVEVAIPFGSCNVFIEAKLSLFHDDVILEDDPTVLKHKTQRVRTAIEQGRGIAHSVRQAGSPVHPEFSGAQQDYLIVVTSRDLLLVSGDSMQRLMPDTTLFPIECAPDARMPLNQIFILDISDYEQVMCTVAEGKVNLPDLLERASTANLNMVDGRLQLSEHIDWAEVSRPDIPLISGATADAHKRVSLALGTSV